MAEYSLTTTANVKAQLGISGSSFDTILQRMIDAASLYAEKYTGRNLKARSTSDTEVLDVNEPSQHVFVKNFPIISITSVTQDGTLVSVSDYYQYANIGKLTTKNGWWQAGRQILSIVYKGGYATVPEDLEQWCIDTVSIMFQNRNSKNIVRETVGTITVEYVSDVLNANTLLKAFLENYKSNFMEWE